MSIKITLRMTSADTIAECNRLVNSYMNQRCVPRRWLGIVSVAALFMATFALLAVDRSGGLKVSY